MSMSVRFGPRVMDGGVPWWGVMGCHHGVPLWGGGTPQLMWALSRVGGLPHARASPAINTAS